MRLTGGIATTTGSRPSTIGRLLVALALLATLLTVPVLPAAAASTATLTFPDTLAEGEPLTIEYTAEPANSNNWIGVYRKGHTPNVQNSTYWDWSRQASGSVTFPDVAPGEYEVYLLVDPSYEILVGPLPLTVGEPDEPAPTPDPHTPAPVNTSNTDGVLMREDFDDLAEHFETKVDDPAIPEDLLGFTHTAPEGWSTSHDDSMNDIGVTEWRGWSFTTREFWSAAEDQMRFRFGRAQDVIAVVDSDEFHDANEAPHTFDATLTSAPVDVYGRDAVVLSFDSHYRGWSNQTATVTVAFDGGVHEEIVRFDSTTVTDNYDGAKINSNETHVVQVPNGAQEAVFAWQFTSGVNTWYWAIDSVQVRTALPTETGTATSVWVVSDIQGHPEDLAHGLLDFHAVRPDPASLLMVGDIVNTGAEWEWAEIYEVMERRAHVLPETVVAAIGNHESYASGGFAVLRDRFLEFADRDQVWDEYLLTGDGVDVPVLVLGQEGPRPPEVPMSAEQIAWLDERLDYWSEQESQVLVISHFPLGDTSSASWIPWYHNSYQYNDLLTEILADHPNAVMLTGHTHYPAELGDWAVQRRTSDGHADGFWSISTLAMHNEWDARGEHTTGIREIVTRDINRGLTIDVFDDRMVVTARDFGAVATDGADTW